MSNYSNNDDNGGIDNFSDFNGSRRKFCGVALGGLLGAFAGSAAAQTKFPEKLIRIVVPFAPGATDIFARLIAKKCEELWGQPAIVENRPGAASILGTNFVAKSAPDGHTLLVTSPTIATNASRTDLPYNTSTDITPIGLISNAPFVLLVSPEVKVKTLQELLDLARARPGQLNFASSGAGSSSHLASELLVAKSGVKMVHVPYTGTGSLLPDLISNRVQMTMAGSVGLTGVLRGGQVRMLGVSSLERHPAYPDVPTIASAVPGYEAYAWFGVFGPSKIPKDIVSKLSDVLKRCYEDPAVRAEVERQGGIPIYTPPNEFADFFAAEVRKWKDVAAAAQVLAPAK